ncbi:glycerophosphoryl diester phosphodiesterase [Streptomyces sp. 2224.1]|uniref:glycerophosphodiester phosphodiesterase n=1 Tax=unclassified Streptomyces TaxID=2593676 RepID=UPI00088823AA|nr:MULTISPECIES: glycerophosphodiester phosphodiesterase family protein [unclassified Streptomyces]PBC84067.1 glycerophosphoryl diester phosphodiesterase [Streptomyces sp. 2321.6]SDR35421.1 glycerophosphoryl diester phosphodiesterase [Streptomyces sp. KS_16]SEB84076.1 glycerophosphoryl diester phosphodiesterase [Streptomyces sp. 2224.1]SED18720.1 glycerophosphoryl diester phosphodiesterase [Streptomyces sp. 2133.1]SEE62598.1 glycerophosphoryl diester phosphodiesterase [Streptomyces sp. 2112.3]
MLRRSLRLPAAGVAYLVAAAVSSSAMSSGPQEYADVAVSSGTRAGPGTAATLVIAHRGASRYAPENTLAAVDAAHRRGLIWVENDVQRSKDGRLVVMHDATLRRTTDAAKVFPGRAPWRVGDFTAAELARLDAGSWFGRRFAGERVPTLADYLRRLDHNGQRLLLEIKAPEKYPGIEAQVIRELRARGWLDRAHVRSRLVVQSFSVPCVKAVHEVAPEIRTGILGAPGVDELARYARFADQINPRASALSSRWLAAVHRLRGPHGRRLQVYVWDVAKNTSARSVRARGAEGVIE